MFRYTGPHSIIIASWRQATIRACQERFRHEIGDRVLTTAQVERAVDMAVEATYRRVYEPAPGERAISHSLAYAASVAISRLEWELSDTGHTLRPQAERSLTELTAVPGRR